jgi:hypothetical protein
MSAALDVWNGRSREALDEVVAVHGRVAGIGAGSRMLTRQVNYAYATLILAHFQQYCRGLHAEATQDLVASVPDPELARVLGRLLATRRLLDRGNPTPDNLGRDFGWFGFGFWKAVESDDRRNRRRKEKLMQLCEWRNGITHGDIARKREEGKLTPVNLTLEACDEWRRGVGSLASSFDRVIASQCTVLGCQKPW